MIHVDRIERRFGPNVLFRDLSWMIPAGSRLGLVGPNGAGKTTLLKILAGLDQPDAGMVNRPARTRTGYLPQEVETVQDGSVLSVVLIIPCVLILTNWSKPSPSTSIIV